MDLANRPPTSDRTAHDRPFLQSVQLPPFVRTHRRSGTLQSDGAMLYGENSYGNAHAANILPVHNGASSRGRDYQHAFLHFSFRFLSSRWSSRDRERVSAK